METAELRSKDDVIRDIEATRKVAKEALRGTKRAFRGENRFARMWKLTKKKTVNATRRTGHTLVNTKEKVVMASEAVDEKIRCNVYSSLAIALGAGVVAGFLLKRRARKRARSC